MRRLLLGTSALCAGSPAGPALAQSASQPVKLGLGGFWNGGYGDLVSQSGAGKANKRTDDIMVDAVINITGSTKFDNGLTAGVMVQLRGENLVPEHVDRPRKPTRHRIRSRSRTPSWAAISVRSASATTTTPAGRRRWAPRSPAACSAPTRRI